MRSRPDLCLDLAAHLSASVPARIEDLCRDLKCHLSALETAAEQLLAEYGVLIMYSDAGWYVEADTWRQCQKIANDYVDKVPAPRIKRAYRHKLRRVGRKPA